MNILLLTQYYLPEPGSASMRMSELAEYLAARGHQVTVVTGFPNYPRGKIYNGYRMGLWRRESKIVSSKGVRSKEKSVELEGLRDKESEGVRSERVRSEGQSQKSMGGKLSIIRVPLYPTIHRKSFKYRMVNHITFMLTAIYGGLLAKKSDLIYFYSPPLFLGITAYVLKKIYRIPTVVEINDLWPQAPIALGVIKNKFLITMAESFEKFVYKNTDYLFFYSHTHRKTIVNMGIPTSRTDIHTLWVDTNHFSPHWEDGRRKTEDGRECARSMDSRTNS